MRHNHYGINCDYARRREFHRAFWDALRAPLRHRISSAVPLPKPRTASN